MTIAKQTIAVIGANGAIGSALVRHLIEQETTERVYALSRHETSVKSSKIIHHFLDLADESSIEKAATAIPHDNVLDKVFVTTGFLHGSGINPEKRLEDLSPANFHASFSINTIGPALLAKYFLPKLACHHPSVFAAISARVGSIQDNSLGGWYAYRASKAALNMAMKCASIEMARRNPNAIVVTLHPGTVDSPLSRPFQKHVPKEKLFSPALAVERMLAVVDGLEPKDSGKFYAWDGTEIPY